MPDTTDLQKRLREAARHSREYGTGLQAGFFNEVADALEAQQAELSLLREIAKRAEDINAVGEYDESHSIVPDDVLLPLLASLQAYKEFQNRSEQHSNP